MPEFVHAFKLGEKSQVLSSISLIIYFSSTFQLVEIWLRLKGYEQLLH